MKKFYRYLNDPPFETTSREILYWLIANSNRSLCVLPTYARTVNHGFFPLRSKYIIELEKFEAFLGELYCFNKHLWPLLKKELIGFDHKEIPILKWGKMIIGDIVNPEDDFTLIQVPYKNSDKKMSFVKFWTP